MAIGQARRRGKGTEGKSFWVSPGLGGGGWQEFSVEAAVGLQGGRAGSRGMHSSSKWPLEPSPQDNGRWIRGRRYSQAKRGPSLSELEVGLRLVVEGRQAGTFRELLHIRV